MLSFGVKPSLLSSFYRLIDLTFVTIANLCIHSLEMHLDFYLKVFEQAEGKI